MSRIQLIDKKCSPAVVSPSVWYRGHHSQEGTAATKHAKKSARLQLVETHRKADVDITLPLLEAVWNIKSSCFDMAPRGGSAGLVCDDGPGARGVPTARARNATRAAVRAPGGDDADQVRPRRASD